MFLKSTNCKKHHKRLGITQMKENLSFQIKKKSRVMKTIRHNNSNRFREMNCNELKFIRIFKNQITL